MGASRGTRKKREDEKEIERNALLRRGRREATLLYTRTLCVSTVLHSVALLALILRRRCLFNSSSESRLVMGRTKFVTHGGAIIANVSAINSSDHEINDDLRAVVHFRDRYTPS